MQKRNDLEPLRSPSLEVDIVSLFPEEFFAVPLRSSILHRALEKGILQVRSTQIRDFAEGKHARVDDRPYGGGPGMVMMPGPTCAALDSVCKGGSRVIYLSPQGAPLSPQICMRLAQESHLVLLCGHYEGVDQRVLDLYVHEEVSIGDYVLTSGGLAALVLLDATARFLPGALGHEEAPYQDSFQKNILEGPQYTRPRTFRGQEVPPILVEGDHAKIAAWREAEALAKTKRVRPDLLLIENEHSC